MTCPPVWARNSRSLNPSADTAYCFHASDGMLIAIPDEVKNRLLTNDEFMRRPPNSIRNGVRVVQQDRRNDHEFRSISQS